MLSPIEFSILVNPGQDTSYLEAMLRRFNREARMMTIGWMSEYLELTNYATYKIGPDVSMAGNQTVSDLVAMNALRPFSSEEVESFGGVQAFVPVIWNSVQSSASHQPFEIPWISDPRLVFYWRDMLADAGATEETAFTSADQVVETLQRLQMNGMPTPLVLAAKTPSLNFQVAASWVWGAGGDFLSPNGNEPFLDHPATLSGMRSFFSLYPFMPANSPDLHGEEASAYFRNRRAAVTVLDICHGHSIMDNLPPEQQANLGIALPPGPPYQGGSSLVVWVRSYREERACELIRFLISPEVQREHCLRTGYLPTRLDTLAMPEFTSDPHIAIYRKALENGRFFSARRGSGLIQNTLSTALSAIWQDIFSTSDKNIGSILEKRFSPVERRLRWVLSQ
jgi:multiple sugar transport system substrate-binding protein